MENNIHYKALLVPVNQRREIFIQDRRGFKAPDWGFFGGGIEEGEAPLAALIREAKEELVLDLTEDDVLYLGQFDTQYQDQKIYRHLYLYQTNQVAFTVCEGRGGKWVTSAEAKSLFMVEEYFDELWAAIEKVLP